MVKRREQNLEKMDLTPKARTEIEYYADAINTRWMIFSEEMYRNGMQDILALLCLRE